MIQLQRAHLRYYLLGACLLLSAIFFLPPLPTPALTLRPPQPDHEPALTTAAHPAQSAGNSTLGFERIVALSKAPSWRTRGLLAAASYTGLEIEIPPQPLITEEVIQAFESIGPEASHPKHGAAAAWLAHLDLIKYVVQHNFDTALIIEDDIDWDVSLLDETVRVAHAVRQFTNISVDEIAPYGREWDVLWLGHCGELVDHRDNVTFDDPTAVHPKKYYGWTKSSVEEIPAGKRVVAWGNNPVCSFAYGLTRRGAMKVLEWTGRGQGEAFDVMMMTGCKSRALNCITVNPEIIHQYFPPRDHFISEVDQANGKGQSVDRPEYDTLMGSTENIVESTRCRVLFSKTCLKIG